MTNLVLQDGLYAQKKGYRFEVCKKEAKGKPWITCSNNIESLSEAVKLSDSIISYEVAIFVIKNDLGFMYWNSSLKTYNRSAIYDDIF